jgi:RNase P subunit RPR2
MSPKKGEGKICPHCRGTPNFIEEFKKYYCFSCNKYVVPIDSAAIDEPIDYSEKVALKETTMICPKCENKADFIMEYGRYYCYACEEYLAPPKKEEPEMAEKEEEVQVTEEVKEPEEGLSEVEEKDLDDYISELDTLSHEPGPEDDLLGSKKKKFSDYRYRSRMLKGSILPILYGIISLQMLNSIVFQFPNYYEYKVTIILAGFILGFGILSGITSANLMRAKRNQKNGAQLKVFVGIAAFTPFIVIVLGLALFESISTAWQFSIGFFLATIFPILIVTVVEAGSKGKFFVRELVGDSSFGRKLVFVR